MSPFVNFNKRGFTLPAGCKDLIDVLTQGRQPGKGRYIAGGCAPHGIQKERFASLGLAQIERLVGLLLQPRGEAFVLQITAEALSNPISLYYVKEQKTAVIMLATRDVPQEEAVRAFFHSRGTEPLKASLWPRTLLYPLPCEITSASALVRELLQEVFALGSDAGLVFEYCGDIRSTSSA